MLSGRVEQSVEALYFRSKQVGWVVGYHYIGRAREEKCHEGHKEEESSTFDQSRH